MIKRKKMKNPEEKLNTLIVKGEVSRIDIGALTCDLIFLGIFIYNQIFYNLNMWLLILILIVVGLYLAFFGVFPEKYHFTEKTLEIRHLFYKVASIPYEAIFNLDVKGKDNFINLLQDNKVKVYYTVKKTKKMIICKPQNVFVFENELKKRCPEFEEDNKSRLKVFFENK